jgi:hypothetical protein
VFPGEGALVLDNLTQEREKDVHQHNGGVVLVVGDTVDGKPLSRSQNEVRDGK